MSHVKKKSQNFKNLNKQQSMFVKRRENIRNLQNVANRKYQNSMIVTRCEKVYS